MNPESLKLETRLNGEEENNTKSKSDAVDLRLLEARTILVEGPVTDRMYRSVCSRLLYLEHKDANQEILVVVNSPGGSADTGFGIYDLMRFISCPVKTLTAGISASAAVLISLGGEKGRRFMLPHARYLLHQPSMATGIASASDMEITAREILRTRQKYAEIVALEVGSSPDKIQQDTNRDFWLDAEECLKYGLVDKIVKERKEIQ